MSKTYGQIAQAEACKYMFNNINPDITCEQIHERIARAVLLEFVSRVEERDDNTPEPDDYYGNEGFYSHKLLADAFRELSTELKEAK